MLSTHVWHSLGQFIGRYPFRILFTNFVFCGSLFSYFLFFPLIVDTDIRQGFAHRSGRASKEFESFGNFYNVSMKNMELIIFVFTPKNGAASMPLDLKLLNEIDRADAFLKNLSVKISDTDNHKLFKFTDVQTSRGNVNFLFDTFKWGLEMQDENLRGSRALLDENINIDYPVSRIYGHKFPLRAHFFDVKFYNDSQIHSTQIESVGMVTLWYMLEVGDESLRPYLQKLEVIMYELAERDDFSQHFSIHMYGDEIANYEMMRGSKRTFKLLAVGMLIMIVFMVIVLRDLHWKQQLILLSSAISSAFFAIGVTISAMCWLNIEVNSLMSIMPFMILGIGVDDSFLFIHSWRKWSKHNFTGRRVNGFLNNANREEESNNCEDLNGSSNKREDLSTFDSSATFENGLLSVSAKRRLEHARWLEIQQMSAIIMEVGPSVFITSFTNMLAFGSGFFSPSSQLSIFCLSTSIAVLVSFIFQFSLFAPCLLWAGRVRTSTNDSSDLNSSDKSLATHESAKNSMLQTIWHFYSRIIVSKWTRVICIAVLALIYVAAFFGAQRMQPSFEPQKTFPRDSRLQASMGVINRIIVQYSPISFVINSPPNISDSGELTEFLSMAEEMMHLPNAASLDLWLNDYLKYEYKKLSLLGQVFTHTYNFVPEFLAEYLLDDKNVVLWHRDNGTGTIFVDKFMFVLVCHGKRNWHERAFFIDQIRHLVDQYPRFNVTVFDYDSTIYDLIITVKAEMFKAILITLVCMSIVCFCVITNAKYTIVAIISVLSTSFTLMGVLGWWGLDLDPVTLIAFLMAIGLSVDITAHICYHFYKLEMREQHKLLKLREQKSKDVSLGAARKSSSTLLEKSAVVSTNTESAMMTVSEKNEEILNAIGKPMIEASISTIICMQPLFFIPIYVVGSFAKTVVAVCILSAIHGLFMVPVLLSMPIFNANCQTKTPGRPTPKLLTTKNGSILNRKRATENGHERVNLNIDGDEKA